MNANAARKLLLNDCESEGLGTLPFWRQDRLWMTYLARSKGALCTLPFGSQWLAGSTEESKLLSRHYISSNPDDYQLS